MQAHLAAIMCNGQEISSAHLAAIGCNGLMNLHSDYVSIAPSGPAVVQNNVGIGLCTFTSTFISFLPCLHTFWHDIPTSFYIFNVF